MRIIDKATGKLAQNVVQERHAFRENFSDLMGGEVGTFASLIQKECEASASRFSGIDLSCLADTVPTFLIFLTAMPNSPEAKPLVNPGLPLTLFAIFLCSWPASTIRLSLKPIWRISPPLQWKGGMICDLFKNKGSPSLIFILL